MQGVIRLVAMASRWQVYPPPIFLPVLKGILHTHFASYTRDTARKVAWQLFR